METRSRNIKKKPTRYRDDEEKERRKKERKIEGNGNELSEVFQVKLGKN